MQPQEIARQRCDERNRKPMSHLIQFPNERGIQEAAGVWIAKLDREMSPAELASLSTWLNADTRHREALIEMADLWDRMDVLKEISELFPLESAGEASSAAHRRLRPALLLLVVPLLAVMAWFGVQYLQRQIFDAEYQTRVGEQRTITLPDHSVVMLNTATLMKVHYTDAMRRVELLQGEAHFQVAKNRQRVFSVRAGSSEFRAVGTAFDVRVGLDRSANLTVTEGRVQVLVLTPARPGTGSLPATEIMVDAGKEVAIRSTIQTVQRLEPTQLDAALAWRHGMIIFDARPLEDALREVSRYSTVHFQIDRDDMRHLPVSGYFRVGDIDALVTTLRTNFNIEAIREGDSITLRPAGPRDGPATHVENR
jgi:transmembrane sensor